MTQQLPVEQIQNQAVMDRFFRTHLKEIVPDAEEYLGVTIKVIRRFDGVAFYNKNIPVTTMRTRYNMKYRAGGKEKEITLYGKATSTFITKPGRMSQLQQYLYNEVFTEPDLQIVRPLGYYAELNLLLRFEASGTTLREIIEKPHGQIKKIEGALQNTARWLARLHKINKVPDFFPRKDDFSLLRHFQRVFKSEGPLEAQAKYNELYQRLFKLTTHFTESTEKRLIHGDFHPDNIFITKNGLIVIDFDDTGMSDPTQDIGSFLVQFRNMAQSTEQQQVILWLQLFLNKYFEESNIGDDIFARINLMQARTIFKNLSHHIGRHQRKEQSEVKVELDLEHIQRLLDLVEQKGEILLEY